MVESVYKKVIEYRFMFELPIDAERWVDEVHTCVSTYADVESVPERYEGNIGYLKLFIYREVWNNDEEYLKVLIRAALDCPDCHYIEETVNEVNNFTYGRVYKNRCVECQKFKDLNCNC